MNKKKKIDICMKLSVKLTEKEFKNQTSYINSNTYQYRQGAMDASIKILKAIEKHIHPTTLKEVMEKLVNG